MTTKRLARSTRELPSELTDIYNRALAEAQEKWAASLGVAFAVARLEYDGDRQIAHTVIPAKTLSEAETVIDGMEAPQGSSGGRQSVTFSFHIRTGMVQEILEQS